MTIDIYNGTNAPEQLHWHGQKIPDSRNRRSRSRATPTATTSTRAMTTTLKPGNLFRLMTKDEQKRLFANTARAMVVVPEEIKAAVGSPLRKGGPRI